jgi:hypothetical protein
MEHGHGHGHEDHANDPLGKKVGIQAALLAVMLAIVTILSHRAHTEGVMEKAEANDMWSYYQATKIKHHNLELGTDLIAALGAKGEAVDKIVHKYNEDKEKYDKRAEEIKEKAEHAAKHARHAEEQASKFDLGEGLLEIGLVLSSLYFISHKKMFPVIGLFSALGGIAMAAWGLLLH